MRFARGKERARRDERVSLNLATMIDVTFLLLIYFLVTMVLNPPEDRLEPDIQTKRDDGSSAFADLLPQRIDVDVFEGAPGYRIAGRVVRTRAELQAAIDPLPRSVGMVVAVGDGVAVGFATTALQVAHDAGFERVTWLTGR